MKISIANRYCQQFNCGASRSRLPVEQKEPFASLRPGPSNLPCCAQFPSDAVFKRHSCALVLSQEPICFLKYFFYLGNSTGIATEGTQLQWSGTLTSMCVWVWVGRWVGRWFGWLCGWRRGGVEGWGGGGGGGGPVTSKFYVQRSTEYVICMHDYLNTKA